MIRATQREVERRATLTLPPLSRQEAIAVIRAATSLGWATAGRLVLDGAAQGRWRLEQRGRGRMRYLVAVPPPEEQEG